MENEQISPDDTQSQAFVIRQPIFDRDKSVWGYELLTGESSQEAACSGNTSLSEALKGSKALLASLGAELAAEKKVLLFVNDEKQFAVDDIPDEACDCVFGIGAQAACVLDQCPSVADSMHEHGGFLCLDSEVDAGIFEKFADKCDILKVSLKGKAPQEIVQIRRRYKDFPGEILAADISSWEAFEGTRALGFKYFQGPFFAIPEVRDDAELSSSSVAKLQLLRELSNPACDMDELASIIASDVSLSFRILKYINSASFGLKNTIKSIQQAVSLLGLNELRHWATVVVMTDIDSSPKGEELAYMALQRGRFLSNLSSSIKGFGHSSNTMFLLGLFSMLDALLSYPMDEALADIPLDGELKNALCGERNEFGDWLCMLEAIEAGDWASGNEILGRYGACFTQAATEYMKASSWAASQLPDMKK